MNFLTNTVQFLTSAVGQWLSETTRAWNQFWFQPVLPHTLSAIRLFAGAMLFYTHLIWIVNHSAFFGSEAWITSDVSRQLAVRTSAWSYLWPAEAATSPTLLWLLHGAALVVFAMLTVGWFTRTVSILGCIITLSYCHRLQGALYGLDQVNAWLAMYLMVGPSGALFSVDRWLAKRRCRENPVIPSSAANVAVRLMQIHLCIVYMFGGIGKMRGQTWWDGSAVWFSLANQEYQTLDLTQLVIWPWLISLLTHITVFWETFYPILVWPRLTRPLMLLLAVAVHAGIAVALGMPTFGLAMLIANMAFLSPEFIARVSRCCSPVPASAPLPD